MNLIVTRVPECTYTALKRKKRRKERKNERQKEKRKEIERNPEKERKNYMYYSLRWVSDYKHVLK